MNKSEKPVENVTIKWDRRKFSQFVCGAGALAAAGAVLPGRATAQDKAMPPDAEGKFREVRRKERALTEEDAWIILGQGLYGTLATVDQNGWPHGTPISYALGDKCIYFHSAKKGQKVDNMAQNPNVCFTVVTEDVPIFIAKPYDYSVYYHSTMAYGKAVRLDDKSKKEALLKIVAKYFPENQADAGPYYEKYSSGIDVYKIEVSRITGKAHRRGTKIEVPTSR